MGSCFLGQSIIGSATLKTANRPVTPREACVFCLFASSICSHMTTMSDCSQSVFFTMYKMVMKFLKVIFYMKATGQFASCVLCCTMWFQLWSLSSCEQNSSQPEFKTILRWVLYLPQMNPCSAAIP